MEIGYIYVGIEKNWIGTALSRCNAMISQVMKRQVDDLPMPVVL